MAQGVLIADEMGLGKTIQALGVFNAIPSARSMLVVCPASLKLNWKREAERWVVQKNGHRPRVAVAESSYWPKEVDIIIINFEALGRNSTEGGKVLRREIRDVEWDLLVIDECHRLKNPKTQRTKFALGIKAKRIIALTGTPIPNRVKEIWPIVHHLAPDVFDNWWNFARRYCDMTKGPFGWQTDGASHLDELQAKLRSTIMVRRLKSEVLKELPPKRRQVIELPVADSMRHLISAEQKAWARAEQIRHELRVRVELAKASDDPKEYEAAVTALRTGARACFEEMSKLRHETALAKLPLVIEHVTDTLEEVGKILIGAHHVDVIEELGRVFDCEVIHGHVPVGDRLAIVDRFNDDPARRVLVVQEISAGVGFSVKASHVIAAELQWVPGDMTQFEDRCHGVGRGIKGEPLLIQHLVLEGSLDAQMARTLIAKQEIADRALDSPTENSIDYELADVDTEILASNELFLPEKVIASCNTDVLHVESSARPATYGTKREQLAHEAGSLTPEQIRTIHHGLRVLAGMCDGAFARDGSGFSRMDAEIGHSLAAHSTLTPLQASLGKALLKKYSKTQLQGIVDSLYDATR